MDMDSRRPPSYAPSPAAHPSHAHAHDPRQPVSHQHQHQHQQPHPPPPPPPPFAPQQQQQQHQHQHHAYQQHQHAPPPPHHSQGHPSGQHQVGPPPPPSPHHGQHHQPPPQAHPQQQPPPQHAYSGAPGLPPQGPALPPLQSAAYAPPASTPDQHSLPPFRHPSSAPPPHDPRDPGPEYHHQQQQQQQQQQYNHARSGHGTPAPVNRAYSQDSGHQRSPITPAGPPPQFAPSTAGQEGPPPPASQHMDHGGHPGYQPNGAPIHHGGPPHHHEHPPPPQYMTPAMENHQGYAPPGQQMYPPGNYGPATSNMYGMKRKQMRATQACEQCRQRKQKCDEGTPCSFCKENNLSCQYRDTPPAKTDKNMEKLLSYMEAHTAGLHDLNNKIDSFEARLRRVEQNGDEKRQSQSVQHSQGNHVNHNNNVDNSRSSDRRDRNDPTSAGAESSETMRPDELAGWPRAGREEHRTAPHKLLLLWPTIKPLLTAAGVEYNDGYVMEAEDRGILRLWTKGEGIDENDGTQPGGPASPARSDEQSPEGNSGPQTYVDGRWGVGFPSTPSNGRSDHYTGVGGLKANGEIDLDANTINQLYESYMRNLHIMHPFLDKRRVRRMFDNFIKRYSNGRPRATWAVSNSFDSDQRPFKRQRSNGSTAEGMNGSESDMRREPTERSPTNCIIFLVLALGKICLHRDPLPAIVHDSKAHVNNMVAHQLSGNRVAGSPASVNIKPSPMSPNATPMTQPTPNSDQGHRSRRSSVEGSSPNSYAAGARNLDVIPGIAYFAKAAEILGEQGDGNDLVHAQMFLLAGLYKGQLARVKESMSWITMAGRAIITLLDRYKLYNADYWNGFGDVRARLETGQKRIKDTRQSLIVLVSWCCLQLESDILAEMKLPDSGIQDIEGKLCLPNNMPEDEVESYRALEPDGRREDYDNILMFYTAQLWLRRKLNEVHRQMYGTDCINQSLSQVQEMLQGHESILTAWRDCLPPELAWNDDDPPPRDILAARLRAKYWGARYVINRPFLDFGLHILPGLKDGDTLEDLATDGYGNKRDKAEVHLFKAIEQLGEKEVWRASQRCVHAAMKSTVAFDGVPDRLIVTNIHGTAHAQFGNMLVLTAVVKSPIFKTLVPEDEYHRLLKRTIAFLRRLSPISPTCQADCGILEKFSNTLFGIEKNEDLKAIYHNEGVEMMSAGNSFNMG